MMILPLVGRSSLVSSLRSVVLPAPDWPTTMTNSRGSTCRLMRSSDGVVAPLYVLVTLSNSIISTIIAKPLKVLVTNKRSDFGLNLLYDAFRNGSGHRSMGPALFHILCSCQIRRERHNALKHQ